MLADLTQLAPLRRLKRVSQAGAPALVRPTRTVTRYEHSVGVAAIAQRLDLPPIHQVASLLHDVTHTPFSHTIDYLLGAEREDTHETLFGDLATNSELVTALGTATVASVVELLRTKPEWLSHIDAIDYTLRDLHRAGRLGQHDVDEVLRTLDWSGAHVVFASAAHAAQFMNLMSLAGGELYMDPIDLYRHRRLANIVGEALSLDAVGYADVIRGDDHQLLRELCRQPALRKQLLDFRLVSNSDLRERRDGQRITSKCRVISPWTLDTRGELVRAVDISAECQQILTHARNRSSAGVALLTER